MGFNDTWTYHIWVLKCTPGTWNFCSVFLNLVGYDFSRKRFMTEIKIRWSNNHFYYLKWNGWLLIFWNHFSKACSILNERDNLNVSHAMHPVDFLIFNFVAWKGTLKVWKANTYRPARFVLIAQSSLFGIFIPMIHRLYIRK